MDFKEIISKLVQKNIGIDEKKLGIDKEEIYNAIEIPPNSNLGDFALPCFLFAKKLNKSPQNIALELKEKLTKINIENNHKYFEHITNVNAYVNFFVNKGLFSRNTLKTVYEKKEFYGSIKEKSSKGKNSAKTNRKKNIVLIESPGPNTNKPLHLGHLRNMLLGQALCNILRFQGKDAKIVNIVNDRGVHICKSMLAYEKFGQGKTPQNTNKKPDHFVGDYYVLYQNLEKDNPKIENEVQEMLVKWENNDPKIRKLWSLMNNWVLEGFKETYKKLDFNIEKEYFESDTYMHGREIIIEGLRKGIFEKDENGAIIINLEDKGLGKKVLLRPNGTSVYITQDIYLAKKRYEDFHFNEMYYVVGNEQEYHFKVLFEIFKRLKWEFADKCYHFSYGMVELPEGKMKSREGNVVDTDELIESVTNLARNELKERYDNLSDKELDERAFKIAMSAIRFFFLKFDPQKNFVYNPKESLSFEGETGPYIEYSYARINSIFSKFLEKLDDKNMCIEEYIKDANLSLLTEDKEFEIIKNISRYPSIVEQSAREMKPSLIAHYLIKLAQQFNEFYHSSPVINSSDDVRKARLYLIYCIQKVLKSGMNLLGIVEIKEM